jgi:hypothetical protein
MRRRQSIERIVAVCTPWRRAQVAGHSTGDDSPCPCSTQPACASTASRMVEQHRRSARLSSVHRLGHSAMSTAEWSRGFACSPGGGGGASCCMAPLPTVSLCVSGGGAAGRTTGWWGVGAAVEVGGVRVRHATNHSKGKRRWEDDQHVFFRTLWCCSSSVHHHALVAAASAFVLNGRPLGGCHLVPPTRENGEWGLREMGHAHTPRTHTTRVHSKPHASCLKRSEKRRTEQRS